MGTRAGVIVTGTEVLTGRVADRNGPWLAEQLRAAGVDIGEVIVVGDRASDLRACLVFLAGSGVDVIITSGGLGPTADDLTAQVVAEFQGRAPRLDVELEARIMTIIERLSAGRGWRLDPEATSAAVRKQALVPVGANVLAPIGTAPGLVVPVADGRAGPPVIVLPGPPAELRPMWPAALADPVVATALGAREELRQRTIRLWGTPESELAALLRAHDERLAELEITTCLRDGELEIVTRFGPPAQEAYDRFDDLVAETFADAVFSRDDRTVDQVVADALRTQNHTIATAESCTAGLLAGRLTDLAGSSDYVRGGLIVYSDAAKHELAGVPTELITEFGAVSAEVAAALAAGARDRLTADIGVGITGVAGPGGGTERKPVGLVHLCVTGPAASVARTVNIPGDRAGVRARTVTVAMHLLRGLLLR